MQCYAKLIFHFGCCNTENRKKADSDEQPFFYLLINPFF
jgi:hypothetical protein